MKFTRFLFLILVPLASNSQTQQRAVIYFDNGSHQLRPASVLTLDSLVRLNAEILWVEGSHDCTGTDELNQHLSTRRAKITHDYLSERNLKTATFAGTLRPCATKGPDPGKRSAEIRFTVPSDIRITLPKEPDEIRDTILLVPAPEPEPDIVNFDAEGTVTLRGVNFVGGNTIFLPGATDVLDQLFEYLVKNPTFRIEIKGHVAAEWTRVDEAWAQDLSYRRARTVYYYLLKKGIRQERMSYRGVGAKEPLFPKPETIKELEQNRRVSVRIIKS